jgi:hypothetical protein
MDRQPLTYAQAGVDVEAGDRAVALMRSAVEATRGPRCWAAPAGSPGWRLAGDRAGRRPHRPGAGRGQRRGRHQAAGRPGPRPPRHRRHRPGRHGGRRRGRSRGRAAVRPRLPGRRPGRPRPGGRHRGRGGRGLPAGPLRPARRGDGRAPWRDGARGLRPAGFALGMVERDRLLGPDRATGDAAQGRLRPPRQREPAWPAGSLPGPGSATTASCPRLGAPVGEALLTPTRIAPSWSTCWPRIEVRPRHVTGGGLPGNLPAASPA